MIIITRRFGCGNIFSFKCAYVPQIQLLTHSDFLFTSEILEISLILIFTSHNKSSVSPIVGIYDWCICEISCQQQPR